MMNSLAPLPDRPVQHATAQIGTQFSAANDSAEPTGGPQPDLLVEPEEDDTHNPLWTVVIGTAILFAAFAALMALG
jgi:hypothetical protein